MSLPRLRWLILGLLFLSTTVNYVDRQALSVLLPTLRSELGLTSSAYGTIVTLFLVAYTVSQLLSGLLIDRIGTRHGLALSALLWSLAAVAHAFSLGAASLGVFRFLLGLGEAGNWPAGGKAIAEWFPRHRRAFAMGVFDGGSAAGAVIAPPLVAALAIQVSWRAAFVVTGLLGLLWLAAWLWIYDTPDRHRWLSQRDRAEATRECPAAPVKSGFATGLRDIMGVRPLWGLMGARLLASPVWLFYVFWLPDYLAKDRGFTLAQIGLFGWLPFLTVDLGKMFGGALSDRLLVAGWATTSARKVVMVPAAVVMTAGILVSGADTAVIALAWVCVATFGFGMWSANILALHADIFSAGKMGSVLGLTGMAASLGGAATTFAVGQIVDAFGYRPIFAGAGIAALLACIALLTFVGKTDATRDRR